MSTWMAESILAVNSLFEGIQLYLSTFSEAVVIGISIIYYLSNKKARSKSRNVRYSQMLLTELEITVNYVSRSEDRADSNSALGIDLPSSVYDGLVSSTNISYFDKAIQEELHKFYTSVKNHNWKFGREAIRYESGTAALTLQWYYIEAMRESLVALTERVNGFRKRNEWNRRGKMVAKTLALYYDDE